MKSTKKAMTLFIAILLAFLTVACGNSTGTKNTSTTAGTAVADKETSLTGAVTTETPVNEAAATDAAATDAEVSTPDKELKVALVLPGSVNDEGWNASAYRGLMKIKDKLGSDTSFTEKTALSEYTQVFRGYADNGFNLIIGHSFAFFDTAASMNEEYPNVWFAISSTNQHKAPNVCSIDTNGTHAGFINGVVAAHLTKTKVVAAIGGTEIPGIINYNYGFVEGVKYVDPTIEVKVTYTGSFEDTALMKEVTQQMIKDGADVISPNANQAANGAFEAVNELPEDKECWILGVYGDQRPLAPTRTAVSAILDMALAIEQVADKFTKGTLEPTAYMFGIKEGAVYHTDFLESVPQKAIDAVEEVYKKFQSGELDVVAPSLD